MASATLSFTNGSFDATGTTTGAFYGTAPITTGLAGWTLAGMPGSSQIDCVVAGSASGQICNGNAPSTFDTGATSAHPANVYYFSLYAYPGPSPDGGNYFLGDGDSSFSAALSQTVTGLVVNHFYQVSFYQAAGEENCLADDGTSCPPPSGHITGQWGVTFGSTTLNSATMTTPVNTSNPGSILTGWNRQTLTFQATSTSQLLSFLAAGTPSGAPPLVFLDGITLTEVAPEPATWVLLGLGLLMLPVGLRLRKGRA
jgi:hypothetical protein